MAVKYFNKDKRFSFFVCLYRIVKIRLMQINYTSTYRLFSYLKVMAVLLVFFVCQNASAQLTMTSGYTPIQMASRLAGPGVAVFNATMNCPPNAHGQFVTVASMLGLDSGIVLTSGTAVTSGVATGVDGPVVVGFGTANGTPGDADLTTLAGQPTFDACILEFDFKPAGDTVSFKYVFGSSEYTSFTCTNFNDVFGFLISGGAFATPTNIAKVPGTSIPVCINSVNCGPTGGGTLPTCTALGVGSPFCAYYVDNTGGTTISYEGLTVPLLAVAEVSPCDTYHLKLGIADAFDGALDSGVFIEAGSLTSRPPVTISGVGLSGLPYCVRGCVGGTFVFTIPVAQDTPVVVYYNIIGTAINGYDYATIPTSTSILPFTTSAVLNINPLLVPATGPKTVTLEILVEDPCHPGVFVTGALATITILDSFTFRIVTPDTSICNGEFVHATAMGDTMFASLLGYAWSPVGTVSSPSSLITDLTPTSTTTYTLTQTALSALGCPVKTRTLNVRVYNRPILTQDSLYVKTCVGIPTQLHVDAQPDTIINRYRWLATTYLNNDTISNPVVTPLVAGDYVYTVTVNPMAVASCTSTDTVHVHVLGNYTVGPALSFICLGQTVNVTNNGSTEFSYVWTPSAGVATSTSRTPVITDGTIGTTIYTVTSSYANCPDYVHTISIHVDTPAHLATIRDTICMGMTATYDITVPGSLYYHYQWSSNPTTMVISNDTIPNPIFTPGASGDYILTAVIQPISAVCAITDTVFLKVLPNVITVRPTDTAICLGQVVQVIGTGDPLFTYQWLPTAGIGVSNVLNAIITPDTSALYTVTAHFHGCPDIYATLNMQVQPTPNVYLGGNRPVCQFDTLHLTASVTPAWFPGYTYTWSPAADLDNTSTSTVVFDGNMTTTLHLVVTTSAGCTAQDSAVITVLPGNFATPLPDLTFCPHDTAILNPLGGAGMSYHWYPPIYISDSLGNSPVIRPITSQSYHAVVTNANGCKDTVHFSTIVYPGALISIPETVTLYPGENYAIEPVTNGTSFLWFPYAGLSNPLVSNPVATPDVSTMYIVNATTENGCKAVDSINFVVNEETLIDVPNAFTPGSGVNGEFKIIKRGIAGLNYFRIFNRWGNMVYESKNINAGWDGSWKGEPQPFGVYVYSIQAVTSTGKVFNKQGNVTVIR